jgi:endoglucanase
MRWSQIILTTLLTAVLGYTAASAAAAEQVNLLSNGDFEQGDTRPRDWPTPEGVTWEQEDGNRFLRLAANPDKMLTVYRVLDVKPEHKAFAVSFRVRANDLQRGKEMWHDGRVILDFKDESGKKLKPAPSHPNFRGTFDWRSHSVEFLVPEGAVKLEVMPAMFNVKSGSLDLDDFVVTAIDPQPVIERQAAAEAQRQEEIARRAAAVQPKVPPAPADKLPPMLRVEGNQIKTLDGKPVWLQGVSIPSMEWSAGGENILQSVQVAIDDWNVNVIRLGVREHFWGGTGPYQRDGGAGYRQLVEDVVNLAGAHGVYVVIDLHRFRAPEPQHAAFWRDVATRYKNHPAVLFELFNEPHDISWQVWRDGGFVSTEKKQTDALTENQDQLKGFESIGMQALVDTVREVGAKNIVIAGGLDWSYDLSGILKGYELDDRDGHGIVYSTHVYPWKSDWQGKFMEVAEKHPIFIGECGAPQERMSFIPESRHEDPSTWVPDFLGLVQQHKYHWTAWSFHPKASPVLLNDWTYEPTPYWGVPAQEALRGKAFEMTRLR